MAGRDVLFALGGRRVTAQLEATELHADLKFHSGADGNAGLSVNVDSQGE